MFDETCDPGLVQILSLPRQRVITLFHYYQPLPSPRPSVTVQLPPPVSTTTHHQPAKAVHGTNARDDAAQRDPVGEWVVVKRYVLLLLPISLFFTDYTTTRDEIGKNAGP
jgi:hypothetical protein